MQYEFIQKYNNGEMPEDHYSVANSEAELVALIERMEDGSTIAKDAPKGDGFHFGRTEKGRFFFETDEFLDENEEKENPAYHSATYDTAKDGVEDFKINGKNLIDAVKGCRFYAWDACVLYAD